MFISCVLQEWHVGKLPLNRSFNMVLELCGEAVSPWSFPAEKKSKPFQ